MNSKNIISWAGFSVLALALSVALLTGCELNRDDVSTSNDNIQVTLSATPSEAGLNSSVVVEALVVDGDTPQSGQQVCFQASPASAGNFSPDSVITDESGLAATVFFPSSTGEIVITASTNTGLSTYTNSVTVTVATETVEGAVSIASDPETLLADGSSQSEITLTVYDTSGQLVTTPTTITLVAGDRFDDANGDGVWTASCDSLLEDANNNGTWDHMGSIPATATTDATGTVTVNYTAGSEPGMVYIRASVNNADLKSHGEKQIHLQSDAVINSIYLSSDSINLVVKHCGGIEIANLHAVGYDIHSNPVQEEIPIDFTITNGPGGGEHLDTVGYGPYTAFTNSQGMATVTLHSGTISGTVRIRARASDSILSNATQVMVSAGPPKCIAVGAEFCNIDYFNIVGEEVGIVAVVSDAFHNPVNDSTVVYFTTDEGTMKSHEERTTQLEGIAETFWISGYGYPSDSCPIPDGKVWVIAETSGGTVKDSTMFYNTWGPASFDVYGMPNEMWADGASMATILIYAWDFNGNPVVDGTSFDGDASFLSVETGTFEYSCGDFSSARVKILSTILDVDYSTPGGNDDGIGAVDTVSYWKFGAYYSHQVVLKTGVAYSGKTVLDGNFSVKIGETAHLNVTVKDRWGNPLGDHTLVADYPSSGIAGAGNSETNPYGEAFEFSWTPADTGSFLVTIEDTDPKGGPVLTQTITVAE
ncbi:MAG: hypothetical protein U9N55_05065 [candidate division Zixibacteria bacterium]|nr:hypothetical protein [candidate division Zixibacteria bacterium]